jgi:hypothetical protein
MNLIHVTKAMYRRDYLIYSMRLTATVLWTAHAVIYLPYVENGVEMSRIHFVPVSFYSILAFVYLFVFFLAIPNLGWFMRGVLNFFRDVREDMRSYIEKEARELKTLAQDIELDELRPAPLQGRLTPADTNTMNGALELKDQT